MLTASYLCQRHNSRTLLRLNFLELLWHVTVLHNVSKTIKNIKLLLIRVEYTDSTRHVCLTNNSKLL